MAVTIDERLVEFDSSDEQKLIENFNRILALIDGITDEEKDGSIAAQVADHETRITTLEG